MEEIRLHLGKKPDLVIFRNQSGAVEVDGRWQTYGLVKGASDLIGALKPSGRFFACEVKQPGKYPTKEQRLFLALIHQFGGAAFVARSVEDAEKYYLMAGGQYAARP